MANSLPAVLTFPSTKQSSISVERSLKHVRDTLNRMAFPVDPKDLQDLQVALDDLDLMIGAITHEAN